MRYDFTDMVLLWGVLFGVVHLVLGMTAARGTLRVYGFGLGVTLLVVFGGVWWWRHRSAT